MPMETTCVQPKFSSFVQISFTLTGLLVTRNGGSFAGKKTSLTRSPNPPKLVPQLTARRLFTGPFGMGRELKNSLRPRRHRTPASAESENFRLSLWVAPLGIASGSTKIHL